MAKVKSEEECLLCKTKYSKQSMSRHIKSCIEKLSVSETVKSVGERYFHLLVEGYKAYWLHLRVDANATLADLDGFLKDIWLECCGHLSQFTIEGINYTDSPSLDLMGGFFAGKPEKRMAVKLAKVLKSGMKFCYEYDFGSTTELNLKVISEGDSYIGKKERIKILARNDEPEIKCLHCQTAQATQICTQCIYEDGWLCNKCAKKHDCGEDMFLPVVNSPRVGVCGYSG